MILQIPVTSIRPSPLNPRKRFDEDGLTELAQSIKADGLLQNLVVRQNGDGYELAAGERRWRALQQLVDAGDLPGDHTVPCAVRDLTDLQLLQLATTENMARSDMSPLEEAKAFQQMIELGSDVDTISAETGLSLPTVRKRLALVERLTPVAQEALEAGRINLGQAQALTITSAEYQADLLDDEDQDEDALKHVTANEIRRRFERQAPPVSVAKFQLSQYAGTFTRPNIFAEDAEDRFDDVEQFRELQLKAVDALEAEAKRSWAWVERQTSHHIPWDFEQLPEEDDYDPSELGVIICYDPRWGDGSVTIHERLRKKQSRLSTEPAKPEADPLALTQKHIEEIGRQRKHALQTALATAPVPRLVHQTLCMLLLSRSGIESHLGIGYQLHTHDGSYALQAVLEDLSHDTPMIYARLYDSGSMWSSEDDPKYDPAVIWAELSNLTSPSLELLLAALTARVLLVHGSHVSDGTELLFNELNAADHLPTFAQLGTDWLKLYRPARLKEVSAAVLGFSGDGKTKKELVSLIAAAESPDVPAELKLEAVE